MGHSALAIHQTAVSEGVGQVQSYVVVGHRTCSAQLRARYNFDWTSFRLVIKGH